MFDSIPMFERVPLSLQVLRSELGKLQTVGGYCKVEVTRDDVFEDSYRHIMNMRVKELRKRLVSLEQRFSGAEPLFYNYSHLDLTKHYTINLAAKRLGTL